MNFAPLTSRVFIATLMFTVFACFFTQFVASSADAAQKPSRHEFKDPYNGGKRLSKGGGEPGKAYMAMINAAYKRDYEQLCKMIPDVEEQAKCLQNKEDLEAFANMISNPNSPKSHKVLDGYQKGDEATLDIAYSWQYGPDTYGSVVIKKLNGKWFGITFGGSASMDVDVKVSGSAEFGTPAEEAQPRGASQESTVKDIGPVLGKWAFEGKDDKGVVWTGTLTISEVNRAQYPGNFHSMIDLQMESKESGRGVSSPSLWDQAKQEFSFEGGVAEMYTAILSDDRKSMTQGKWNETKMNRRTGEAKTTRTGVWSAKYTGQ